MTRAIYLTRNGLLEPLGQSQVMSYLRGLSKDYEITLITYEKPEDWLDKDAMARAKEECSMYGIIWLPQLFRLTPKIIAPALSIVKMTFLLLREVLRRKISIIHARSYIPATAALLVNIITRVPFIFDMRALWPEELIAAGRLQRGSLMHRAIVLSERACLARSSGIISLTYKAVDYLKSIYPKELKNKRIVVIPTCADLERFTPSPEKRSENIVHGCIGTLISGWFKMDWLTSWFKVVALCDSRANFEIITRDEKVKVKEIFDSCSELEGRIKITSSPIDKMPNNIQSFSVSVMFFTEGLSKLGSAPTRLAEILGCGVPVVVNEGVGDVADIVKKNNVGIIVNDNSDVKMKKAYDELLILMKDPALTSRCRSTAETLFSLKVGTNAYRKIYSAIINNKDL